MERTHDASAQSILFYLIDEGVVYCPGLIFSVAGALNLVGSHAAMRLRTSLTPCNRITMRKSLHADMQLSLLITGQPTLFLLAHWPNTFESLQTGAAEQ